MTSQISRFIFNHHCNSFYKNVFSKMCSQKCEYLGNENFLDQIKTWFLKDLVFEDIADRRFKKNIV